MGQLDQEKLQLIKEINNNKYLIMEKCSSLYKLISDTNTATMMFQSFYIQGCSIISNQFGGEGNHYYEIMYCLAEQYRALIVTCKLLYHRYSYYKYEINKQAKGMQSKELTKIAKLHIDNYDDFRSSTADLSQILDSRCKEKTNPEMLSQQIKIVFFFEESTSKLSDYESLDFSKELYNPETGFISNTDNDLEAILNCYDLYISYKINTLFDTFHSLISDEGKKEGTLLKLLI